MELDKAGIDHEINFWRRFVKSDRFIHGWMRKHRTPDLQQKVYNFLQILSNEDTLLDVGSGPISIAYGSTEAQITTSDPLSRLYQEIVDFPSLGIAPPLEFPAEEVDAIGQQFTCVLISNAYDHAKDPFLAMESLLKCVEPGGTFILQGFENEALHENYAGFHQINLSLKDNHYLTVNTKDRTEDIFPDGFRLVCAETALLDTGRNWITFIVTRE